MSDPQPPEDLAAAERMMAEIEQEAMDLVTVACIEYGVTMTEDGTLFAQIGVRAGSAAAMEALARRGLIRG